MQPTFNNMHLDGVAQQHEANVQIMYGKEMTSEEIDRLESMDQYYLIDSKGDFVVGLTMDHIITSEEFTLHRFSFPTAQAAADVAVELGWGFECRVVVYRGRHALICFKNLGRCQEKSREEVRQARTEYLQAMA